jgi:hypothetical protein
MAASDGEPIPPPPATEPPPRGRLARIADRLARDDPSACGDWLTRFVMLRLLGLVYLMASLTLVNQGPTLIGAHGLLPLPQFLDGVANQLGSRAAGFAQLPSIFWLADGDGALRIAGYLGVGLSVVLLAGWANTPILVSLLVLQISIAAVGQTFYGFGWELQLVETGFLATFLVPALDGRPFPRRPPPGIAIWLMRWLAVRLMWGAGLIKLRGDACWRDLTCLDFHFETQPIPSPLTPFFHRLPPAVHAAGVIFNHVVELASPLLVFGPRRARHVGGALMLALQIILIASGNLSFLNWLTLIPIVACFDDGVWRRVLPRTLVGRADRARAAARPSRAQGAIAGIAALAVIALSIPPVLNLASGRQLMNTSFTRLPLVNTYGAFGSVGRDRLQLVFEATDDPAPGPDTRWRAYRFKCQPSDVDRRPCWMSPYHHRLDWLLWFAAMGSPREYPWAIHLVARLLEADRATLNLIDASPLGDQPPRFVRVELYRYRFAPRRARDWWQRERLGAWLPPLDRGEPGLRRYLTLHGWED